MSNAVDGDATKSSLVAELLQRESNAIEKAEAAEDEINDLRLQLRKLANLHQGECEKAACAIDLISDYETQKGTGDATGILDQYKQVLACTQSELVSVINQYEEELTLIKESHDTNNTVLQMQIDHLGEYVASAEDKEREAKLLLDEQHQQRISTLLKHTKRMEVVTDYCETLKAEILRLTIESSSAQPTPDDSILEEIANLTTENADLKSRLKSRNEALLSKTEEAEDLEVRIESLEHLLSEQELDKTTNTQVSVSSTGSRHTTSELIEDLNRQLKTKTTTIESLQQENQDLLNKQSPEIAEAEATKQQLQQLQLEHKDLQAAADNAEALLDELMHADLQENDDRLQSRIDELLSTNTVQRETVTNLQDEVATLKHELNAFKADTTNDNNDYNHLQEKYESLQLEYKDLQSAADSAELLLDDFIKNSDLGANEDAHQHQQQQQQLQQQIDDLQAKSSHQQLDITNLRNEIQLLSAELDASVPADQVESYLEEIEQLKVSLAQSQKIASVQSEKVADIGGQLKLKTFQAKESSKDLSALRNKAATEQETIIALQAEITALKSSSDAQQEIESLKKCFAAETTTLKEKISTLNNDNKLIASKLSDVVKESESFQKSTELTEVNLREEIAAKTSEISALKERFAKDRQKLMSEGSVEANQSFQRQLEDHSQQAAQLQKQVSDLNNLNISLITCNAMTKEELEQKVDALEVRLEEERKLLSEQKLGNMTSNAEIQRLSEQATILTEKLTDAATQHSLQKEEIDRLNTTLSAIIQKNESLEAATKESNKLSQQLVSLREKIDEQQKQESQNKDHLTQIEKEKSELASDLKKLRLQKDADSAKHKQAITESTAACNDLKNQLQKLQDSNGTSESELKNEITVLKKSNLNLKSELSRSTNDCQELQSELTLAKAATTKVEIQLKHNELSLSRLEKELAASKEDLKSKEKLADLKGVLQTTQEEGEGLKQKLKEARTAVIAGMAETTRRMALEKRVQVAEDQLRRYKGESTFASRDSSPARDQSNLSVHFTGVSDSALEQQLQHLTQQLQSSQQECATLRQKLHESRVNPPQSISSPADVASLKQELNNCRRDMVRLSTTHKELLTEFELVRNSRKQAEKRMMEYKERCQQLESKPTIATYTAAVTQPHPGTGNLESILRDHVEQNPASAKHDQQKIRQLAAHLSQIIDNNHMSVSEVSDAVISVMSKRQSKRTTPVRGRRFPSPAAPSRYPAASYSVSTPQAGLSHEYQSSFKPASRRMSPGRPTTPRLWR